MKKILIALIVLVFSQAIMAGQEKIDQTIGTISGDISISAEGLVTAVDLNKFNDNNLKNFLLDSIKKWQFYPMQINGQNTAVNTSFSFDLLITHDSKKSEIKKLEFQDIIIDPTKIELDAQKIKINQANLKNNKDKRVSANYPRRALLMNIQARVDVVVKISPEGKVEKADVNKFAILNSPFIPREIEKRQFLSEFSRSALNAVKKWQFSELSMFKSDCIHGCISTIRIDYIMDVANWRPYLLVETPPVPWAETEEVLSDISTGSSNLVRLKDDPTGKPIDIGG